MLHASRYTIIFDPILSTHAKKAVKHIVEEKKNNSLREIADAIHAHLPFIQYVEARHDIHNRDRFIIRVKAYRPQKNINNTYYITENHTIIPRNMFVTLDLPIIYTKFNAEELSADLISFIMRLKKSVLQAYTVSIATSNSILLKNVQNPKINIITSAQEVPSKELMATCQKIINEKLATYKGKKKLYGDIRFKNQIIVFEDIEGKIE